MTSHKTLKMKRLNAMLTSASQLTPSLSPSSFVSIGRIPPPTSLFHADVIFAQALNSNMENSISFHSQFKNPHICLKGKVYHESREFKFTTNNIPYYVDISGANQKLPLFWLHFLSMVCSLVASYTGHHHYVICKMADEG